MRHPILKLLLVTAAVLLVTPSAQATTIQKLDLDQMVDRAGHVFRGTVLDVRTGSVEAGGAQLPTTTFVFRVEENFKGSYDKEHATVEITMLGSTKGGAARVGDLQRVSALPELPNLRIGSDYLMLTTPESRIGLSIPVGLGQGTFSIVVQDRQELAVNALDNANLEIGGSGPISYAELSAKIRALLGQ